MDVSAPGGFSFWASGLAAAPPGLCGNDLRYSDNEMNPSRSVSMRRNMGSIEARRAPHARRGTHEVAVFVERQPAVQVGIAEDEDPFRVECTEPLHLGRGRAREKNENDRHQGGP